MRYVLSFLFSLVFLPNASAFVYPSGTNNFPNTQTGNVISYIQGTVNPSNIAPFTFSNSPGGPVTVSAPEKINLPGGRSATVTPRATLSPSVVGPAVARAAAKLLPWVAWGIAIKGLMDDLGFTHDESGFRKSDPTVCTVAPCYAWQGTWSGAGTYTTQMSMCTAYGVYSKATAGAGGAYHTPSAIYGTNGCIGGLYRKDDNTYIQEAIAYPSNRVSAAPQPAAYLPSTEQEFANAIAAQSGWPSGSKIGAAIKEAVEQGETLPFPAPSEVTGPTSVPGTSTTTQKVHRDAQGNQTGVTNVTTNTVHNFTYSPNTVTINTVTTTTTTNPDGSTETSTDQKPEESEDEAAPSDTPLGSLPVLYERKYPDGLTGVWNQKKAALTSSPLLSLVSGLMPSVGLTGTCPILMVNLDVGFQNFGTHDFAPPCWIWDFGRVVVIVSALLLARALIFGG